MATTESKLKDFKEAMPEEVAGLFIETMAIGVQYGGINLAKGLAYASDKYGTMPIGEQIGKHVLGPTPFWFATVLILINHINNEWTEVNNLRKEFDEGMNKASLEIGNKAVDTISKYPKMFTKFMDDDYINKMFEFMKYNSTGKPDGSRWHPNAGNIMEDIKSIATRINLTDEDIINNFTQNYMNLKAKRHLANILKNNIELKLNPESGELARLVESGQPAKPARLVESGQPAKPSSHELSDHVFRKVIAKYIPTGPNKQDFLSLEIDDIINITDVLQNGLVKGFKINDTNHKEGIFPLKNTKKVFAKKKGKKSGDTSENLTLEPADGGGVYKNRKQTYKRRNKTNKIRNKTKRDRKQTKRDRKQTKRDRKQTNKKVRKQTNKKVRKQTNKKVRKQTNKKVRKQTNKKVRKQIKRVRKQIKRVINAEHKGGNRYRKHGITALFEKKRIEKISDYAVKVKSKVMGDKMRQGWRSAFHVVACSFAALIAVASTSLLAISGWLLGTIVGFAFGVFVATLVSAAIQQCYNSTDNNGMAKAIKETLLPNIKKIRDNRFNESDNDIENSIKAKFDNIVEKLEEFKNILLSHQEGGDIGEKKKELFDIMTEYKLLYFEHIMVDMMIKIKTVMAMQEYHIIKNEIPSESSESKLIETYKTVMDELNGEHVAVLEQSKHDEVGLEKFRENLGEMKMSSVKKRALSVGVTQKELAEHGLIPITGEMAAAQEGWGSGRH